MKTSFLELKSRNLLLKTEMQNVKGGGTFIVGDRTGTCAVYSPNGHYNGTVHAGEILNSGNVLKSLSKEDALNAIQGVAGARWCCDSCGSASWL